MKKPKMSKMIRLASYVLIAAACACLVPASAFADEISVLNPRANLPPIQANPLAPRLSSLEGKTVYVNGSDANMNAGSEIMLMVARALAQAEPGMKVVYLSDRYGDAAVDPIVPSLQIVQNPTDSYHMDVSKEAEQKADAVVTGLGY